MYCLGVVRVKDVNYNPFERQKKHLYEIFYCTYINKYYLYKLMIYFAQRSYLHCRRGLVKDDFN